MAVFALGRDPCGFEFEFCQRISPIASASQRRDLCTSSVPVSNISCCKTSNALPRRRINRVSIF